MLGWLSCWRMAVLLIGVCMVLLSLLGNIPTVETQVLIQKSERWYLGVLGLATLVLGFVFVKYPPESQTGKLDFKTSDDTKMPWISSPMKELHTELASSQPLMPNDKTRVFCLEITGMDRIPTIGEMVISSSSEQRRLGQARIMVDRNDGTFLIATTSGGMKKQASAIHLGKRQDKPRGIYLAVFLSATKLPDDVDIPTSLALTFKPQ